ncbi:hypothetical protein CYMTET_53100, partial [Cymbomonas tetramitiformis]
MTGITLDGAPIKPKPTLNQLLDKLESNLSKGIRSLPPLGPDNGSQQQNVSRSFRLQEKQNASMSKSTTKYDEEVFTGELRVPLSPPSSSSKIDYTSMAKETPEYYREIRLRARSVLGVMEGEYKSSLKGKFKEMLLSETQTTFDAYHAILPDLEPDAQQQRRLRKVARRRAEGLISLEREKFRSQATLPLALETASGIISREMRQSLRTPVGGRSRAMEDYGYEPARSASAPPQSHQQAFQDGEGAEAEDKDPRSVQVKTSLFAPLNADDASQNCVLLAELKRRQAEAAMARRQASGKTPTNRCTLNHDPKEAVKRPTRAAALADEFRLQKYGGQDRHDRNGVRSVSPELPLLVESEGRVQSNTAYIPVNAGMDPGFKVSFEESKDAARPPRDAKLSVSVPRLGLTDAVSPTASGDEAPDAPGADEEEVPLEVEEGPEILSLKEWMNRKGAKWGLAQESWVWTPRCASRGRESGKLRWSAKAEKLVTTSTFGDRGPSSLCVTLKKELTEVDRKAAIGTYSDACKMLDTLPSAVSLLPHPRALAALPHPPPLGLLLDLSVAEGCVLQMTFTSHFEAAAAGVARCKRTRLVPCIHVGILFRGFRLVPAGLGMIGGSRLVPAGLGMIGGSRLVPAGLGMIGAVRIHRRKARRRDGVCGGACGLQRVFEQMRRPAADLTGTHLGRRGGMALAHCMARNCIMTSVDLTECHLDHAACETLI